MTKGNRGLCLLLAAVAATGTGGFLFNGNQVSAVENQTAEITEKIPVQLLGINDFHGALSTTGSYYDDAGNKVSNAGTAALLASYLNQAESTFAQANSGAQTLRVQSGDMVGASPANSGLLQDEPTIKVLNEMNFTIGTLGNHEFDEGLAEFDRIMKGMNPKEDPYGILSSYSREASKTEIVVGNVVKKDTEDIPFNWQPYTVKEIGTSEKVKIGFIGVVTTEIPNLVLKEHYQEYDFLDEAETIAYYASELKEKGVNAIVVLAHVPSTSKEGTVSGEAANIMKKVNELYPENSVDVFLAGHNHVYTNGLIGDTRVVQSTSQGKGYADIQGVIDVKAQDFEAAPSAEIVPVSPEGDNAPKPDEKVAAIVADADRRVSEVTSRKIGTAKTAEAITREVNEYKESPLGNLITDGQLAMAKTNGIDVDFAMTNNGGIRADLAVGSNGEITWGAAQAVQPFGNIMQIVEMTGSQIEQVLNEQYDEEEKYFLQISGLSYTFVKNENAEQPYKVWQMKDSAGKLIEKDQTYRVVINDFLLGGGDGFAGFTQAKLVDAMQPDTETFIGYIESKEAAGEQITAAIESRKQLIEEPAVTPENREAFIRQATFFDPLHEKDQYLQGVTLPNAMIVLFNGVLPKDRTILPEGDITAKADNEGRIKIDISTLNLKDNDVITAVVVIEELYSAVFPLDVLRGTIQTTDSLSTVDTVESDATKTSSEGTEADGSLPNTGETITSVGMISGAVLLAGSALYILRKRSNV
ncbi:bifunctional metallophosphatase/5'-nucleotidase [Enterococcus sp. CWB-B31]|uniref:bifunctional metallophosphatase/5'-nucleotidase n=1 Tax=Enterococcus sp. CWB-B31 TaxID=2885159 RepID=UPI001E4F1A65|nr:bifunctional metallophosphatase/5'-nucleotidase [Enterococcus sp. CWB-B31]MCB5956452.1 5'-nucleotidase C-terminal domain-containing protein [Enterococcus sp. CWB-B31]